MVSCNFTVELFAYKTYFFYKYLTSQLKLKELNICSLLNLNITRCNFYNNIYKLVRIYLQKGK